MLSKIKVGLSRKSKKRPDGGAEGGGVSSSSAPAATDLISPLTLTAPASGSSKTSSITTIIAQPPPEQVAPSVPQPPNLAPTSQAPAPPSAQSSVSDTPPTSNDTDPWTRAYEIVQERERELMADYKKHLASLQDNAATSTDLSTPRSVEPIVNKLWDDREKKQWQRLAKFLLWSDPIVKNALSAQPHAALAWSGVSLLLPFYSYIIEYQARVICHLSRAQLSRAWQDVAGSNDWAGKIREIDKDSQLQAMQESLTILDGIRQILEENGKQTRRIYEDKNKRDVLQDLESKYEDDKDHNPLKVPDTCEWFFTDDRFRQWRDSSTSSLLWVSAGPGCGKSVLSRALIDERRLSTNVTTSTVCYFFFKDGDGSRMNATNALCAILHQLFTHGPTGSLIGHALPSHERYPKTLAQNFAELWRILLMCADSPDAGEIVCVLDALDECNADGKRQLLDKLKDFYCLPRSKSFWKLKFLITGRPDSDLEASFKRFSDTPTFWHVDGDDKSAQISKEIDLVIDARVGEIARDFEEDDRGRISERLKSMEHRTYLWLHLTFNIIEWSPSDVETLLSDLPTEVSKAYEKILDRSKNQDHAETLLQILLAAARPLTLDEANIALTLALQKQRFTSHATLKSKLWSTKVFRNTVKSLCGLFISIAREFLIHLERKGKWEGRLNMSKSHSTISRSCLHYLLLPDIHKPVGDNPAEDKQTLFLPCAAAHWHLHYVSQEAAVADQSRKDVRILYKVAGHQAGIWAPSYLKERYMKWEGWTDLALASYLGLTLTVEDVLREEGADVNVQGGYYGTALRAASAGGYQDIVQILLDKGADVNVRSGSYDGTALQAASAGGYQDIVQILLDKGADVNVQGEYYGTALQAASRGGHKEIVQKLLDKGAE
ncbi:hypothetical protein F5882DRAFT_455073 [Hyaloscypha sp. PMI_1271]|nr:hypothetical protein F5882DRAFT_455073 [Hyaloscypha sp. PMI_1271]